jgi:hypothetical protein
VIDVIRDRLKIASKSIEKLCRFQEKDMGTASWGHGLPKG